MEAELTNEIDFYNCCTDKIGWNINFSYIERLMRSNHKSFEKNWHIENFHKIQRYSSQTQRQTDIHETSQHKIRTLFILNPIDTQLAIEKESDAKFIKCYTNFFFF